MTTKMLQATLVMILGAALVVPTALAQAPAAPPPAARPQPTRVTAPQSNIAVDGSEAMFTTMCALLAAGFEADVSADH